MQGDGAEGLASGPLEPAQGGRAVARPGDIFRLGAHRLICGDATDVDVLERLTEGDEPARLILTDEPYNVRIAGHVTGGAHREFAMASGEMSDAEFLGFDLAWMKAALPCLCEGGVFGTFIDWRGYPTEFAAASELGLDRSTSLFGPKPTLVWGASTALSMSSCRCSRRGPRRT